MNPFREELVMHRSHGSSVICSLALVSILTRRGNPVLVNTCEGAPYPDIRLPVGYEPVAMTSTDLDGDGDRDLVSANTSEHTVSVVRNQGALTFAPQVVYAVGSYPTSVTTADVDHDGDADLAVTNSGSTTLSVLFNQGDGTFAGQIQ
jgi:hypothetical protein